MVCLRPTSVEKHQACACVILFGKVNRENGYTFTPPEGAVGDVCHRGVVSTAGGMDLGI